MRVESVGVEGRGRNREDRSFLRCLRSYELQAFKWFLIYLSKIQDYFLKWVWLLSYVFWMWHYYKTESQFSIWFFSCLSRVGLSQCGFWDKLFLLLQNNSGRNKIVFLYLLRHSLVSFFSVHSTILVPPTYLVYIHGLFVQWQKGNL